MAYQKKKVPVSPWEPAWPHWHPGVVVKIKANMGYGKLEGKQAVVKHYDSSSRVLLEFSERHIGDPGLPGLHDGDGRGAPGRCLYVSRNEIELYHSAPFKPNFIPKQKQAFEETSKAKFIKKLTTEMLDEAPQESKNYARMGGEYDQRFSPVARIERQEDSEEVDVEQAEDNTGRLSPKFSSSEFYMASINAGSEDVEEAEDEREESAGGLVCEHWPEPKPKALPQIAGMVHLPRVGEFVATKYGRDGRMTVYHDIPGYILEVGSFGRVLVQFVRRVPGGHNGKGRGEPGKCKWLYRKDLIAITPHDVATMEAELDRGKPAKRLRDISWREVTVASREVAAASEERVAADVRAVLPDFGKKPESALSYLGEIAKGSRVIVISMPYDNKYLKGKKGAVLFIKSGNATVEFDEQIPGGHDGCGMGKRGNCWNINMKFLKLVGANAIFYVKEDFRRCGQNLKGMKVKVLAHIAHKSENVLVVEFEKEVPQGHSADGKGKKAHCLTVPASIVGQKKKTKKEAKAKEK